MACAQLERDLNIAVTVYKTKDEETNSLFWIGFKIKYLIIFFITACKLFENFRETFSHIHVLFIDNTDILINVSSLQICKHLHIVQKYMFMPISEF